MRRGRRDGDPRSAGRPAHGPRPRRRAAGRADGPGVAGGARRAGATEGPRPSLRSLVGSGEDGAARSSSRRGARSTRRWARRPVRAVDAARRRGRFARTGRSSSSSARPASGGTVVEGGAPAPTSSSRSRARDLSMSWAELPEPLADPRLDFQVDRASALAYEVKAGEYIQVIDVRAGSARTSSPSTGKLQAGRAGARLDGHALADGKRLPEPGLYSKFFDHDLEPLVEVVRDTVGRHDTFGLACTKYYEDMGYFGHVNCSENFNAQLDAVHDRAARGLAGDQLLLQHGVRRAERVLPRRAVVATRRLRAPAGADRPRVPVERVPRRHRRGERLEPDRGARPRLPGEGALLGGDRAPRDARLRAEADARDRLPPRTSALTSRFTEYNGYWLPTSYDNHGAVDEYWACRERGGDHGPLAAPQVRGARARRRGAPAGDDDARRPPARRRPGRLHGDVQRHRRDARRRDRLPARRGQLPLDRRLGVRRRLAARAGGAARAPRVGQGVDRRPPQRRRPGAALAADPLRDRLDVADADAVRRAEVVPLLGRAARRPDRDPDHRVADRLLGRARLRALLPPEGRAGGLGPRARGGRAARARRRSASTRSTCSASRRG